MTNLILATDPAKELAELCDLINKMSASNNHSIYNVLASNFGFGGDGVDFMPVLSAVSLRIKKFNEFVFDLEDEFATERVKLNLTANANKFRSMLSPKNLVQPWGERPNFVDDRTVYDFEQFSRTARAHRPLRKISDEEISAIKSKLNDSDFLKGGVEGVPKWATILISSGIAELDFQLTNFKLFGHEAVINELLLFIGRVNSVSMDLMKQSDPSDLKRVDTLQKLSTALLLVGGLFCLPSQVYQSYQDYQKWIFGQSIKEIQPQAEIRLISM